MVNDGQSFIELSQDLSGVTFVIFAYCRFLSLSHQDFIACSVIHSTIFIEQFFKNYTQINDKLVHLPTSRTFPLLSDNLSASSPHTWTIFSWIRYASTYDQLIYLNPDAASAQILLQWLDHITGKKVFQVPLRSINKESPEQNLLWFNSETFHKLSEWLANQFEKNILKFYFNRHNLYESVKKLRSYMRKKAAQRKVIHFMELSIKEIKQGILEKNSQLIIALRSYEDKMKQDDEAKLINLTEARSKKRKKQKGKQKMYSSFENSSSITKDQSLFQSLHQIQVADKDTQPRQKNNYNIQFNKFEANYTKQLPQNQEEMKENQKSAQKGLNPQMFSPMKSASKKSEKTCCGQCSQQEHDKNLEIISDMEPFQDKNYFVQSLLCEVSEEKKNKRKRKATKTSKFYDEFKKKSFNRLINKQLDNFLDSLSLESNSIYESKVLAFQRVRYFIQSIFPQAEASLFGSNAVGLSLPSSDIDIMVAGIPHSCRDQLCDYLSQIGVYINSMGWVVSCSTYLSAKVPLLKLEIDTSIKYFTPKIKLDYQQRYDPYLSYFLDLKGPKPAIIKVDITIAADQSLASPSTELMRYWLHEKPSIQRILLALKYTLAVRGCSQNFKGGIGSYCLFVMVAAYFQHFDEKRQQSDCEILLDILKFYGEQFQNHLKIIHLTDSEQCFFMNQQALKRFQLTQQLIFTNSLKILDPLNSKLMSSSCYQYASIKSEWRRIRQNILKMEQFVQQDISTHFTNVADMLKLISNQKSFEKWINRLQARMETSIGEILKGSI